MVEFRLKGVKDGNVRFVQGFSYRPKSKVEGDEMELVGDIVKIYADDERELVATFRLDVNQHVRKM